MENYDVIVIGAGAAGLIAALELALAGKKVCVLEAKDRCGGRMHTINAENNTAVELGAEFVHGNLPITKELLRKAGGSLYEVKGRIWQKHEGHLQEQGDFIGDYDELEEKFKELEQDISVKDFLENCLSGEKYEALRFTLQNYVEGYYAADIAKASTFALRTELTKGDEEQYRIEGGYEVLLTYLETQCKERGVHFIFSQPVQQLHWKKNEVTAITQKSNVTAKRALITVPVGVLQAEGILFSPRLPQKTEAAKKLGFGHVVKVSLVFEEGFWKDNANTTGKDLHDLNFLFSEEAIPTWWTRHPKKENIITGWLGGPKAQTMHLLNSETIIQKALYSLSNIFSLDVIDLKQMLQSAHFYNWSADEFSNGAYSYEVMDGEKYMRQMLEPVENTVYFAGEGLHHGNEIGTVEAALNSGRTVAQQIIAQFE